MSESLAASDELPVSAAAIQRMAARLAEHRGAPALARALADAAGQGPELLLRRGDRMLPLLRRWLWLRAGLWLLLAMIAFALLHWQLGPAPAWASVAAITGLGAWVLAAPARRLGTLRRRLAHFEAARRFEVSAQTFVE